MKNSFLLNRIKKNIFNNIPDIIFNKFIIFSKNNPGIVSLHQIFLKLMIMDFVIPFLKKYCNGGQILEIGCGSGIHSTLLSNFGKVSATDLKKSTIILGENINTDRKLIFNTLSKNEIDFRFNDGTAIPFKNETFDLVFHNSVIEHVPDVNIFNKEVHRILKPGGICICITGTPSLCRYRYIRNYALRFPLILIHSLLKASFKTFLSKLTIMKKLYSLIRSRIWHFYPTNERIKDILKKNYDLKHTASSLSKDTIIKMYPNLLHFLREPEYNDILIKLISARNNVSPESLLMQFINHFKSPWNEFMFNMTPQTHSQHTENYKTEIQEWKVKNWLKSFTNEYFYIHAVCGYRYHHIFGMTYNLITHLLYPFIHMMSRNLPPWLASEFILIAEKERS